MNRPFRNEPEASTELEQAALWYEEQRPGLGTEFLEAVDATLERIATWPQAAAPMQPVAGMGAAPKRRSWMAGLGLGSGRKG